MKSISTKIFSILLLILIASFALAGQMGDITNSISQLTLLAPIGKTADFTSSAIDRQSSSGGLGFNAISVLFVVGNAGDTWDSSTTYSDLYLTDSDDDSTYTLVTTSTGLIYDSKNVTLTSSGKIRLTSSSTSDNKTYQLGYRGGKRYLKAVYDITGTHSTGTIVGIVALRGLPSATPVSSAGN